MSEKNIQQDRPAFHGGDIRQIDNIIRFLQKVLQFGANVNPLGLSATLKKDLSEHSGCDHQLSGAAITKNSVLQLRITVVSRWNTL